MPRGYLRFARLFAFLAMAGGTGALAAPLFTLDDEGRTFVYRARPGDLPSKVADMFGVPPGDLEAFLRANGISDATRVGPDFVYRAPNPLGPRLRDLQAENERLVRQAAAADERARGGTQEATAARAALQEAETRLTRLAWFEAHWPLVRMALVLLALGAGAAGTAAWAALRRRQEAERYARTLARELEEKRKAALAERQESGRRTLDLETRIRTLEARLGPRVVVSGRGS